MALSGGNFVAGHLGINCQSNYLIVFIVEKHWFVFYTKSRHEKKVRDLLGKGGFEVFLPMHKVLRQWSDRKKRVEVPLFNSYIFVHEEQHRIPEVLKTPGVSTIIRVAGKTCGSPSGGA